MDKIRGVVERVTYANEETGYSVIKIRAKGYMELVTVVGSMASVSVGTVITADGQWTSNPKYGKQFDCKEWVESLPASIYGIEKYLGSGLIKGIGHVYAKKIVQLFEAETLDIIEMTPDRLIEVPGIGKKRVEMIKAAWQDQKEIKNIMIFLQDHGVSTAYGSRIYRYYKDESVDIMKENPYQLADDIYGIGFKTADSIAEKLGIEKDSFKRCRAGIFYTLSHLSDDGHCYATEAQLVEKCVEILEIEGPKIVMTISHLCLEKELIKEEPDIIYLPPFYFSEEGVAKRLNKIMMTAGQKRLKNADKIIASMERQEGITYDKIQRQAIKQASASKVMVLTGGPGTGKTTVTHGIIQLFKDSGLEVLLAAPTGRAAKRLSEATKMEAKTIHRLLEFQPPDGYKRTKDSPLEGDVLIVDEASMIDLILMYNLLKAVPDHMSVVIVGDIDQLPSVGAGNVLRDIIKSQIVSTVQLKKIFRQALGSQIITNAHRINKGVFPILKGGKDCNFFYIEEDNTAGLLKRIHELVTSRLPKYYGINPIKDIQVLTPMQKTEIGAANINKVLQQALNKNYQGLRRGATDYKLMDKVMQIRNNYDKDVYNGDIGYIAKVNMEDKSLEVNFDGRLVEYEILDLDELVLAYATTIHKAQGSEYPVVIIPVSLSHYVMLQRNLLYTGITRAKKVVVLVGCREAIKIAVNNNKVIQRNTKLSERIKNKSDLINQ